ncbi:cytochrome P450 [Annulohypoxylon maeteangense]|uniref:cytochrome P450 n=1 Tax=Annulohypoxylon maeteangense TaxID=1927788 RepID=UPI002007DB6F|nr:cytochrome P450 [Annulohypoxylon maeteangense]KAI0889322.1 cytochrome P450 [Annulohypoxylon maeteangense]
MATSIFSLQGATLAAGIESVLISKVLPDYVDTKHPKNIIKLITLVFAINYAILFVYSTVIYPNFISPLRNFPRPKWWLPRMIYARLATKTTQAELLLDIIQDVPNDGIVALREITESRLLITGPSVLADLLVHHSYEFEKPQNMRKFLGSILGNGLVTTEGEDHKFLRKNSLNAFSFRRIKDLYPMIWKNSLAFTDALEENVRQQCSEGGVATEPLTGKAEMSRWASKVTLNIIGIAGLGRDFDALNNSDDPLVESYETIFNPSKEMLVYFVLSAWFSVRFVRMLPWKMNQAFEHASSSLRRICSQLVSDKREAIRKNEGENVDILSLLIKSENFSDTAVCDQLLTYLAAGHDTSALSLTWASYLLALDPDRQSKLRTEVRGALASAEKSVDGKLDISSTLERLPFLNGVLNETLRLYPSIPVTIRIAARDTTLAGKPIPKGTEILISPWLMNRSRTFWGPDAAEFKPERWIEKDGRPNNTGGATSNYEFLSFLHGPRACIGQTFARAELRCLLAALISRFEWKLDMDEKDVVAGGAITLAPVYGLHVELKLVKDE